MMYYSDKARISAIYAIRDCIEKISEIPGSYLSYNDARRTTAFLNILIDEIKRESRKNNTWIKNNKMGQKLEFNF